MSKENSKETLTSEQNESCSDPSRRDFIKITGVVAGGLAADAKKPRG